MTSKKARFLASLVFLLLSGPAFASPSISFVGVGDFASPSLTPSDTTSSKFGLGAGILIGIPLDRIFIFEFGGLYLTRKFDDASGNFTLEGHAIQIPALVRFRFNRFISIGAGGYYAKTIGNETDTDGSTGIAVDSSPSGLGLKSDEFGLLGSFAIHVPITMGVDLTLDGRYVYGLTDLYSTSPALVDTTSYKSRDAQALVGLTFHAMGGR